MDDTQSIFASANKEELYAAYFQKSSAYYLKRLEEYKKGNKTIFNVYAFFFGIFWLMYRKMYKEAVIIILILFVEGVLENAVLKNLPQQTQTSIDRILTIFFALVIGTAANSWYFRKAEKAVNDVTQQELDRDAQLKAIEAKGGVSYWFLLLLIATVGGVVLYFLNTNN